MEKERFKMIASVYLLLERNGTILLTRRFQTGFEDGKYGLASGHVDGRESLTSALRREAQEEIGIDLDPSQLRLVHVMHRWRDDHERMDFFFTANEWSGEITNMEPHKCDDVAWFPFGQLPTNTIPYIEQAIDCWQSKILYSEFNWPK